MSQQFVSGLVEGLESRSLFSVTPVAADVAPVDTAGPQVVTQRLLGPSDAVTGLVIVFNEALDRASAENLDAYVLLRKINTKGQEGGLFDAFVPFLDTSTGDSSRVRKLRFDSAVYDDATFSVTLTPHRTFRADKYFRQLRIAGQGDAPIRDVAGNRLDGESDGRNGRNCLLKFSNHRSKKVSIKDRDGDRMTVRLSGHGKIVSLIHRKFDGQPSPILMLVGTDTTTSVLSGSVKQGKHGDGVFEIQQLSGISTASVTFLSDPAFAIDVTYS